MAGVGSRRACETWIEDGRVRVNGALVTELGTKIQPGKDRVAFDGRPINPPSKHYYIALNKPRGVVSSRSDTHAAHLVTDLVELPSRPMLRPVGRLDQESEGLIFLTDDGDFLYKMTHPKYHVPKTYRAEVRGVPSTDALRRLRAGLMLEDGFARGAEDITVWPMRPSAPTGPARPGAGAEEETHDNSRSQIELTIFEGRNRQVRRMLAAIGHPVSKLTRVRIGAVRLTGLAPGAWRHLTPGEVAALGENHVQTAPSLHNKPAVPNNKAAVPNNKLAQEKTWQTATQPLKPPRAPSSPSSPRPTRPAPPRTSSRSPKKGSTTG